MFKKRVLKKSSSRRVKEEGENVLHGVSDTDANSSTEMKSDNAENPADLPDKKLITDKDDIRHKDGGNTEIDSKAKSGRSSKDAIFKPDTMVEEQYHQLRKNEKLLSESKYTQKRDRDGDRLYSGMISHKSKKDELVKPSSTHVRQNYIMDYQADVCKDFLKNGYCGFGDTCKFLHYREEFKKVEAPEVKEWEAAAKRRKKF